MTKKEVKDFQEEYNRLSKEIEEQFQAGVFAQSNIDNITNMILIPYYTSKAEMRWQEEYPRNSQEFNNHVEYDVNNAKLYIESYISCRKGLETRRPFNNPEDSAWNILESDLAFIRKNYPDIEKNIGKDVTKLNQAFLKHKELQEELNELLNGTKEDEDPVIDPASEISNIEQKVEKQVETVTNTPTAEGHTYPVALVTSWTNEMQNYNDQLNEYMSMLNNVNFNKVDRMWLKKQVLKFINWLKKQLSKLREKIVRGLKGMMQPIKKALNLIKPIISPPSPTTIISWATGIISIFTEPYNKIIQFISDFSTYTPPLISNASKLAGTVATIPGTINTKMNELTGEGANLIKEEIANAVSGITFDPPSMGDLS
jgi:hypothetical protein